MKLLTYVLLLLSIGSLAQPRITLRSGYGMYSMKEMKDFQSYSADESPVPMKSIVQFPGYLYYEGSFSIRVGKKINIGHDFTYGSTGGRIHYSDYSGEAGSDQLLQYSSFGTHATFRLNPANEDILLEVSVKAAYIITNFELLFDQKIGDETETKKYRYSSLNGALQPDFSITKKFGRIGLHAVAGYNFSVLTGRYSIAESTADQNLSWPENTQNARWDGLRIGLGVHYFFNGMDWWD